MFDARFAAENRRDTISMCGSMEPPTSISKSTRTFDFRGGRTTISSSPAFFAVASIVPSRSSSSGWPSRVPHRSQRLLWEPGQRFRIVEPADGAILNRHDGETATAGLRVAVEGVCAGALLVNGQPTACTQGRFQTHIVLGRAENDVVAASGESRHQIRVLWDRDSVRRGRRQRC